MSKVLCVTEYQAIRRGDVFSPEARTVTADQFRRLERFNEKLEKTRRIQAFRHGARNTLVAQNFVGVVHLGTFQVEVLPKIDVQEHQVRRNLLQMVAETVGLKLHGQELASIRIADKSILEVLIRLYCDLLWEAVHKGIVRRYERRQDNLTVLRGRLNVAQQLRHNVARPDRLHCTFDEFTPDNPLNQALKAALRVLLRCVKSESSSKKIAELLFCFDEVSDVPGSAIRWSGVGTDRLSERYSPLLRMARLFIEGDTPDLTSGAGDGFAVLFDMNVLFEEYVGRQVRHVANQRGFQTRLKGPRRHLASREDGTQCFALEPDIVVMEKASPAAVLDTKWKRLKFAGDYESVSTSDLYQMFAYARQYQCSSVILLYPHHPELGDWKPSRGSFTFNEAGDVANKGSTLHTATVPLNDLKLVRSYLDRILDSTMGSHAVTSV